MPGRWAKWSILLSNGSTGSLVVHSGRADGEADLGGGLAVPVDRWVRPLAN